jgi:hypothetical protein
MSKAKKPFTGNRIAAKPKVKPLDPGARLAPHRVAAPPPGKFDHCDGQAEMDFTSDEERSA